MKDSRKQLAPTVRKPDFGLARGFEKYYAGGSALLTHFVNSLHVIFPAGEKYFIRAVKAFEKENLSPDLRERLQGFIGQEAQHMAAHQRIWSELEKHGVKANEYNVWYSLHSYEGTLKAFIDLFPQSYRRNLSLAFTAALEHYTAILAELLLTGKLPVLGEMDERMQKFFRWHAVEELEHKSVAFDLLEEVDGSLVTRYLGLLSGTLGLWGYTTAGWIQFMRQDKELSAADIPGLILKDGPKLLELWARMTLPVLEYLLPDFHPDQRDSAHLVSAFFQEHGEFFPLERAG
jgi:uncharacterized protein